MPPTTSLDTLAAESGVLPTVDGFKESVAKAPTWEEFRVAHAACERRKAEWLLGGVYVVLGMYAVAGLASLPLVPVVWASSRPWLILALMLGGHLATGWILGRTRNFYRSYPALRCPYCDGRLINTGGVFSKTGKCPQCGRRLMKETPGELNGR